MEKEAVIRRFKTALPTRFEVPKTGRAVLSGCLITLDESTGKAQKIDRILINEDHPFSFD
ncbi:YmdB family metallophosphoesterase [Listeria monocytogenes]